MSKSRALAMLRRLAAAGLLAFGGIAAAADGLATFTDAAGCNLYSSPDGVRRLREIASQGRVQWEGACRNGFIEGPGILRHEGLVEENGRKRRYAFFLTGVARAGMREGTWIRETFNMFTDSQRYWTSLAVLRYSGSIARGSPQMREVRSNTEFSAAFRRFLAEADRELAQRAAAGSPAFAEAAAPPPPPLEPAEPLAPAVPATAPSVPTPPVETPAPTRSAAPGLAISPSAPAASPSAPQASRPSTSTSQPAPPTSPLAASTPSPAASAPQPAPSATPQAPSTPATAPAAPASKPGTAMAAASAETPKPPMAALTDPATPTATNQRSDMPSAPAAATVQVPVASATATAGTPARASPPSSDTRAASSPPTTPSRPSPATKPTPAAPESGLRSSPSLASVSRDEPRPEPAAGAGRFTGSLALSGGGGLRPSGGPGLRPREPVIATGPKLLEQIHGCYMDTINGTLATEPVTARRGEPLRVTGWAVDPENKRIPEKAWLRIASAGREGGLTAAISRNVKRPDVGKALGDSAFESSGFDIAIPTTALESGDYIVGIIQQSGDAMLICQSMGRFSLR